MAASTSLTPAQRTDRARKAARARTTVDHHIKALADAAPDFTEQQRAELTALIAPFIPARAARQAARRTA